MCAITDLPFDNPTHFPQSSDLKGHFLLGLKHSTSTENNSEQLQSASIEKVAETQTLAMERN